MCSYNGGTNSHSSTLGLIWPVANRCADFTAVKTSWWRWHEIEAAGAPLTCQGHTELKPRNGPKMKNPVRRANHTCTMLVKRNATLIHEFFASSLEEVDQLWRWLTIDEVCWTVFKFEPPPSGGHGKFLIQSCVSFDQHCIKMISVLFPKRIARFDTL